MTDLVLRIDTLAPLLFRDARPFTGASDETRAQSLDFPPPSAVIGFIRTTIGTTLGWKWTPDQVTAARRIRCVSSWLVRESSASSEVIVPAPADAVPYRDESDGRCKLMRLSPCSPIGECLMPDGLLPVATTRDDKPLSGYRYWRWDDMRSWLSGAHDVYPAQIPPPLVDERVQIGISPKTQTTENGKLFTVEYRDWESGNNSTSSLGESDLSTERLYTRWVQFVHIDVPDTLPGYSESILRNLSAVGHFGGERRPVAVTALTDLSLSPSSDGLIPALTSTTHVTCHLLSPGLFSSGWKPGWIGDSSNPTLVTNPPEHLAALTGAKLVSAIVPRHETVAGWDHDLRTRGPKATRWAAPVGSVYFLELAQPFTEQQAKDVWLASISDDEQDQFDGYGKTLWGVWKEER